jgi:TonB family protein
MKRYLLALVSTVCIGGFGLVPAFSQEPAAAPPASPPSLAASLEQAFKLINDRQFEQAKVELERATALAGGPCGECLLGMSSVYEWEKKWDQSVDAAQRAIPLLSSPTLQARAYDQIGMVYMGQRIPDALIKSEDALRRGASLGGTWGALARYHLVEVLMMQKSWGEALEEARRYLKEAGPEPTRYVKQAHVFICWSRSYLPEDSPPPEAGPDTKLIRSLDDGITRPELLWKEDPANVQAGSIGKVILKAVIDEEGCVQDVKALRESSEDLNQATRQAFRKWAFLPATLEGRPVKSSYVLNVDFHF